MGQQQIRIRTQYLTVILLLVSAICNIGEHCHSKQSILIGESKNVASYHQPNINHVPIKCYDFITIDDLVLTTGTQKVLTGRNLSKINNRKEFTVDYFNEYPCSAMFCQYENYTLLSYFEKTGESVGYFENNNISNYQRISNISISNIHTMKRIESQLFLFYIGYYDSPCCEIYDIEDIEQPALVGEFNLTQFDYNASWPSHYEYELFLDYNFYKQYLYYSDLKNKLTIYDCSNLSNPIKVKEFESNCTKVFFQEELMFCLSNNKLEMFDNINPLDPISLTNFTLDNPQTLTIQEDILYIITERDLVILEREESKIRILNAYSLPNFVDSKFFKIILKGNFALILTQGYTTGLPDTQTDLYIFDIDDTFEINLLYPRIKLPYRIQIILFNFVLYGVIVLIIIIGVIIGLRINKKLQQKERTKEVVEERSQKNKHSIPSEELFEKTLEVRWQKGSNKME